jgi:hypothetical protein
MSMFNWLKRKSTPPASLDAQNSDLGQLDATVPIAHAEAMRTKPDTDAPPSKRKALRLEQRELLYIVVRECMNKSGILSSGYKFKVLSLDSRGKEYLVMVDLQPAHMAHPNRLVDIEGLIARHAKALHDILVTAVYWRVNDQVSAEIAPEVVVEEPTSRQQHLEAFKESFAANEANNSRHAQHLPFDPEQGHPQAAPDFADTEIEEPHSPIGKTQYGNLT